jgi:hypothetical protein
MNPAITVALIAASQQKDGKEAVLAKLRGANAFSTSTAIPLELDEDGSKHLEDAIGAGVVRRTPSGRLYLDKAAQPSTEGWGFVLLLIILITLSVVAAGFALTFIL